MFHKYFKQYKKANKDKNNKKLKQIILNINEECNIEPDDQYTINKYLQSNDTQILATLCHYLINIYT